jgi:hypothetical protein
MIPIIAIQMKALKLGDSVSLLFTTVVDVLSLGSEMEDEGETVDRKYWESRASKESLKVVDTPLKLTRDFAPRFNLKYNKYTIGVANQGISQNFISFIPRKSSVILYFRRGEDEEIQKRLEEADLDVLSYDRQWEQYRIRLKEADLVEKSDRLKWLMKKAYDAYMK